MSKRTAHTHTGTCQACGARQAVDNATRILAKHGYKVAGFGFFAGVCPGSFYEPAELSVDYTRSVIRQMGAIAAEADRVAGLWHDGSLMVVTHTISAGRDRNTFKSKYVTVPMFGCADYKIDAQRGRNADEQDRIARQARSHAFMLKAHVLPCLGKPLTKVPAKVVPREFKEGEVIKLYGKPFKVLGLRRDMSGRTRYVRGHYVGDTQVFTPTITKCRAENKQS